MIDYARTLPGTHQFLDMVDRAACSYCGAAKGDPCVKVRRNPGDRRQGQPADWCHAPRYAVERSV